MISEKNGGGLADTTRREACRRNARIPQPIEAAPPFPFCGTALYSKKPWHFGTGASRTQSVRTRRNDVPSVLIVEDHALFRSGLKQLIGIEPGLTVAGDVVIGDPAKDLEKISLDDFYKNFTGVLLLMNPTSEFKGGKAKKAGTSINGISTDANAKGEAWPLLL